MKSWLILFMTCMLNLTQAVPMQDHQIDPKALRELTSTLGIAQDGDIVAQTQMRWLRRPYQERWEVAELAEDQKEFVLKWASKNRFFDPWGPVSQSYDKGVIMGATTSVMQARLNYLAKLWKSGVRFKEVVWLTGDRPLDKRVDGFTDRCTTESDAARMVWDEADVPEEMHALPVLFVALPMKTVHGILIRPTTEDTIDGWIKKVPHPCSSLFVSSQPFCGYQFAVIKKTLPQSFSFDVVGPGIEKKESSAAVILDSIARWLFVEKSVAR
jgi:hypothetical protein